MSEAPIPHRFLMRRALCGWPQTERPKGSARMFDLVLLMAGVAFFAASIHYVFACDRL